MIKGNSTTQDKVIVCGTAFASACACFITAVLLIIPVVGMIMQSLSVPDLIQQMFLLFALFGLPIIGAFWGLRIGMNFITEEQATPAV